MTTNLLIATGAGLAARTDDQLLVSTARRRPTSTHLPVNAMEWARMRETRFGDPARYARPGDPIPAAALSVWEDTVAAAGACVDGRATLLLAQVSPLVIVVHIEPADGSEPLDLPIDGVPVVATLCPHHATPDWEATPATMPYAMPLSLEPLVRGAYAARVPLGVAPIMTDRQYAGYSVHLGDRRVDVTGPAGFVFPGQLAGTGVDARAVHEQILRQLDWDEPADVVTDFEHRYLASALLATRYRTLRDAGS
jgi:hypothetical protein